MDHRTSDRLAAAAGVLFAVLIVIAANLAGQRPPGDAATQEVAAFLNAKRVHLLACAYLSAVAVVFFVFFLTGLRDAAQRAEGSTGGLTAQVFGSGLLIAAVALVTHAIQATLAAKIIGRAEPGVMRAFYDTVEIHFVYMGFLIAVFVGSTTLLGCRTGWLPRWLVWLGIFSVLGSLISTLGIFFSTGLLAPAGLLGDLIRFLPFVLWVVAMCVILARGGIRAAES